MFVGYHSSFCGELVQKSVVKSEDTHFAKFPEYATTIKVG
jgi:hypothetical protein